METAPLSSLEDFCKAFIEKHQIGCAETVYQSDRVSEASYEFIEGICERVGYIKDEDEE